jgi:hypothetical protein
MKRGVQIGLWIVLAPILGLVQGLTSILLHQRNLRALDDYALISLFYRTCWFLPAVILADAIFLRRALKGVELRRYVLYILICALVIGLGTPGYLLMLGYPLTAVAILVIAYSLRKPSRVPRSP